MVYLIAHCEGKNTYLFQLPFVGETIKINDNFKYEFELDWSNLYSSDNPGLIIIDPYNYSKKTKSVEIEIINTSKTKFSTINIYDYDKIKHTYDDFIIMKGEPDLQKWTHRFTPKQDYIFLLLPTIL